MTTGALNLTAVAQRKIRYASILRCLGQALEALNLKAVEVKTHGDDFVVQAWNRGTAMAMDVEKIYQPDEIRRMDAVAREQRKPFVEPPDLLSLSQVFRLAGNYVDRLHGRLLRVSWQDQSDKIQSVTVQWEPLASGRDGKNAATATIEELCIHIYKQRKIINLSSERDAHRPFVAVGRMH
jgi:hypothetical protein